MKYRKVTITLFMTLLLLVACSTKSDFDINENEIKEIKVTIFEDFGRKNEDNYKSIEKSDDINILIDAINKSKRIEGAVDMPKGDYNLELKFNDGTEEIFHLWISEEDSTGTVMSIEDTEVAYELTKKYSEEIQAILSN